MAIARFKDLCIDTGRSETLGRFWAATLGLRFEADDAAGALAGDDPSQRVWMNVVPEQRTAKQRVHLDVHCESVDELVGRGATVLAPAEEFGRHWTVLADPEGGEFCAFVRPPERLPDYRLYEVVVDSAAPHEIAGWWAEVLGARVGEDPEHGWCWLDDLDAVPFEGWVFVPVPEPKTVKNRIHWDVTTEDVSTLVTAGASLLRGPVDGEDWSVLADPEGNEFCAFVRRP